MIIPIEDIKGKQFGMLVLNDEAIEILKLTGVALMVDFDITKPGAVIGYLH